MWAKRGCLSPFLGPNLREMHAETERGKKREEEIVEAMMRLTEESRELIRRHRVLLKEYERLKEELNAIRASRHNERS